MTRVNNRDLQLVGGVYLMVLYFAGDKRVSADLCGGKYIRTACAARNGDSSDKTLALCVAQTLAAEVLFNTLCKLKGCDFFVEVAVKQRVAAVRALNAVKTGGFSEADINAEALAEVEVCVHAERRDTLLGEQIRSRVRAEPLYRLKNNGVVADYQVAAVVSRFVDNLGCDVERKQSLFYA